jgi:hypothetical protein
MEAAMIRQLLAHILRLVAQRLDGPIVVHVQLDGRQIAESVTRYQHELAVHARAMRQ